MGKRQILFSLYIMFLVFLFPRIAHNSEQLIDKKLANKLVRQNIDLLNNIIRNPTEASLENWAKISNRHDQTEEIFYMNYISDGSLLAYDEASPTMKKFIKHFEAVPAKEPSISLQYLRLSLMMYNDRVGPPPHFIFQSLEIKSPSQIVATCDFNFINLNGENDKKRGRLVFDIDSDVNNRIILAVVCIEQRAVWGWWYEENIENKWCR